ncbi:cytochrome c oxidase accessory protein CcoG [Sphingomonas sp. HDW15A]|uniref:cytochrome c oxidase accessory protein CcoG n=1 Tax=Sphingomonas sp. HDW15A TaxID=2714942 RepID=UPI00140DEA64|nr:cytochrome c oxidase accessory protein CcoG [Sphingomonas sp. HDW15A]QIK95757.1 cytochrome c oxidase accessory protein CcoG [Sphingomonas sp. HDW15A]
MRHADDLTNRARNRFFEKRRKVFPRQIDGHFRRFKWLVMAITLAIYYLTPWLRWDRGPHAPDQAVLVDLAHRRFYMFSIEIWPHEFYYVAGLLIMAAIGLFLVTSAVGRAWCGYACPQTVWTDLFQHVERFIDGDRNAQRKLDEAPWGATKIAKRLSKWTVWLLIGMATGGAWVFYFTDAPTLARELLDGTAPRVAYATIFILTMTTFIFGGFMREQVCIYMCPWPRIQGAMLDEQSLVVTYKDWRGEPRGRGLKRREEDATSLIPQGDCIDCLACVAVCPTGIDIREGPQIGCITCALCIDACDQVMDKIGKPRKLIGYTTIADEQLAREGKAPKPPLRRLFRLRTLLYFGVWAGIGSAMLFTLGTRERIELDLAQSRNPLWIRLSDGDVRNAYTVKIRNMENRDRRFIVSVRGIEAELWDETMSIESAKPTLTLTVPADKVLKRSIYVAAPGEGPEETQILLSVRALDVDGGEAVAKAKFNRPDDE